MITLDGNFQLKRKAMKNQKDLSREGVLAPSYNETALWGEKSEVDEFKKVANNSKDVSHTSIYYYNPEI